MIRKEDLCRIGVFTKPHGIKGEIGFMGSNFPGAGKDSFVVCEICGIYVPFFVEGVRSKTQKVRLVQLAAVGTEDAARRLAGRDVFCLSETIVEEEDDSWAALCGYVLEDDSGAVLGEIVDVDQSTQNVLLIVEDGARTLLVPAVEDWITGVDEERGRLRIRLPEGLLNI